MLTLLRHGESEWNRDGRFSGWADVDLSLLGVVDAERAGRLLARETPPVEACFTSLLRRARRSGEIVLATSGRPEIPIESSWRLNERHYGGLQGLRVWPAVRRYGPLRVLRCRRHFHVRPPVLDDADPRLPHLDHRYAQVAGELLPRGESLADVQARLLPYWRQRILPELAAGRHVLVVSHKNLLRTLLTTVARELDRPRPAFSLASPRPMILDPGRDAWQRLLRVGAPTAAENAA